MLHFGLAELKQGRRGRLAPRVPYNQVRLEVSLTAPSWPTPD